MGTVVKPLTNPDVQSIAQQRVVWLSSACVLGRSVSVYAPMGSIHTPVVAGSNVADIGGKWIGHTMSLSQKMSQDGERERERERVVMNESDE